MLYVIPLETIPDQEINVVVAVGDENISLTLRLRYNTIGAFWNMDVSRTNTGKLLISRVPMLPGVGLAADVLRQFSHLGIGMAMILPTTDNAAADCPDITSLGTDFVLLWGDGVTQ